MKEPLNTSMGLLEAAVSLPEAHGVGLKKRNVMIPATQKDNKIKVTYKKLNNVL